MIPIEPRIRPEEPADIAAIARVTELAFRNHQHSQQTEHLIIDALRRAGALTLSLVAQNQDGEVVGHVAFSPVRFSDGSTGWYGLGPISVTPNLQNRGIGKALVTQGLSALRALGAAGCALVGEPRYYARFGFRNDPECIYEGIPQQYFQVLPFGRSIPKGTITFHEAFAVKA